MSELEQKGNKLEGKITELENKNLYLEAYSRRENIKFENIVEKRYPIQSSGTKMSDVSRYSKSTVLIRRKTNHRKVSTIHGLQADSFSAWPPIERH